jgi:transcriptional regulator with XRE-family HTH domain
MGVKMDYLSHNVSVNMKTFRQSKGMSLDQVAEQTGVSKSMLAQIEKGTANPSLGVLGKITSGLRIEFQELIAPPRVDFCLVTPEQQIPTKEMEGQYKVWTCFPYEDNRFVEIYRIDVEPGGSYVSGSHGEKTREYLTVIDGEMMIECHGHTQVVKKEQVYRFETDQTHCYRNEGSVVASCMCFFLDYK